MQYGNETVYGSLPAVFNWSNDDVVRWLESYVELPQYSPLFRKYNITGRHLPRSVREKERSREEDGEKERGRMTKNKREYTTL